MRQSGTKACVRVLVLLVAVFFMLRWFEHYQVYAPSTKMEAGGPDWDGLFEDVHFTASDGVRLNGWFFTAKTNAPRGSLVLLLLHGNGGNLSHRFDYYQTWLELGVNVFAFDYRGYGRSEGRPGEPGTYLDAQAAYQWLRQKGFAAPNIIALGKSLGGGVASELALREPLGGLILQSTFTSIPDIGAELFPWLPVRWMSTIKYETHRKLPLIKVPLLIMHSRSDRLIRFHHAEKNLAAANEPKMLWEIVGEHNTALDAGRARYLEGLEQYLTRHFTSGSLTR